ncbi:MAG: flagellar basal-body rod modification protein FlgD [Rhodobacteraceae bacterium HLUCCA08]|nr:MAG: flagellar basal-body rod modification protein FlgD [Rhodobacteraceae bacterium HLUCCA08]
MEPTALTQAAPSPTSQAAPSSRTVISSDFETFLKMLTVQMENQDPLNPVESTEYATQLATFSSVEQQVLTNDLLQAMIGQMGVGGMAQMAGWVGREARAAMPARFDGDPIALAPQPEPLADRAEIVVRDAFGTELERFGIDPAADTVTWSGTDWSGTTRPDGIYSFTTISYQGDEVIAETPTELYARVQEVRLQDGATMLILDGGVAVPADDVTALRSAEAL